MSQNMEAFSPPMGMIHSKLGYEVYNRMLLVTKLRQKQVEKVSVVTHIPLSGQ